MPTPTDTNDSMTTYNWYGIYFLTNKNEVRLPFNPTDLTITYEGEPTNYNLIGKGEVVIPRNSKLAKFNISSFFPRLSYIAGTNTDRWLPPEQYVAFFKFLLESKTIFHVVVNRYDDQEFMFDTSFDAILTSFTHTDKGGEPGDVYYELSISEYRSTLPEKAEVVSVDGDTTYLAATQQRPTPEDEFCVGDMVVVSGPVYQTDDAPPYEKEVKPVEPDKPQPSDDETFRNSRSILSKATCVIGRILPPCLLPGFNRVYLNGIGWVDKADCVKTNVNNTIQRKTVF